MEPSNDRVTDDQVADQLDAIARQIHRLRKMLPSMTMDQLATIADPSPLASDDVTDNLLDLDTWLIVAAAALREGGLTLFVDLAG